MFISGPLRWGICAVALALGSPGSSPAQPVLFDPPLSPRIANYEIEVQLDTAEHTLDARQLLTWHNKTGDTIGELQFHLYLNAFRNTQTTAAQEVRLRGGQLFDEEDFEWSYIEISRIGSPDGEDLTDRMEYIQPDDGNEHDKTVMRLPLRLPVVPGDSIQLEIDFAARLPSPPFRTGFKSEYYFVGQWFPKVGVYIDGAWNCHQFHSASEFFADFGVYDVRMTVPSGFVLGATGIEVDVTDHGDGTATHYYHAEDVHDFAWTCSPEYVEYFTDTQDVQIRLLMQPDRISQVNRYMRAAKLAVGYMQDWVGDYPFPNLTVVDPRRGALYSSGMEYPTLFTTVGNYAFGSGFRLQETTTIHEFAHQYWQHMVATNEFEEPWLDEGLTTYSETRISEEIYGPEGDMIDLLGIRIGSHAYTRAPYAELAAYDRMANRAWEYYSDGIEANNAYYKAAMMFFTLQHYLGEETMDRALRTYFERWRFGHPRTTDLIAVFNEVSGEDLGWFFDQVLHSKAVLDYGVSYVRTRKDKEARGFDFDRSPFDEDEGEDEDAEEDAEVGSESVDDDSGLTIAGTLPAGSPGTDDDEGADEGEDEEDAWYDSVVKVRRLGEFVFPVVVEVVFDDGETVREQWDGRDPWRKFTYRRQAKLVSATVDPDRLVPMDINFTNNSRQVEREGVGVSRLWVRILFWAQFMFDQPDFANVATLLMDGIRMN